MAKGKAGGWVFVIIDPDTNEYVFVSNSRNPNEAIYRMLRWPSGKLMKDWVKQLFYNHTEGIQIAKNPVEPFDGFEHRDQELDPNMCVLQWKILTKEIDEKPGVFMIGMTEKYKLVKQLQDEGHNLLNIIPGTIKTKKEDQHDQTA